MPINKGYYFALLTAFVSGLSVFLNKFAVAFWKNSAAFTSAKNILVALILSVIILAAEKRKFTGFSKNIWAKFILLGVTGGSIPFLLFFKGLSLTSAANGAFMHKTMFVWVAVMAYFFLKEKIRPLQLLSLAVLGASVVLLGLPLRLRFGYGDFLILLATLMWSVETLFVQKYMKEVPVLVSAWARMFFGAAFLLGYLVVQGETMLVIPPSPGHLIWVLVSSAFLFAYITGFYAAIKYASAAVASSVLVIAAPITIMLNYYFAAQKFPSGFVLAALTALLGAALAGKIGASLRREKITSAV